MLFLGESLATMIVYVWSRRNPGVMYNFFGLFTFQAPYLPWLLLLLSFLFGGSVLSDLVGKRWERRGGERVFILCADCRDRYWPRLLLPRGCLSQQARWIQDSPNPTIHVSNAWCEALGGGVTFYDALTSHTLHTHIHTLYQESTVQWPPGRSELQRTT